MLLPNLTLALAAVLAVFTVWNALRAGKAVGRARWVDVITDVLPVVFVIVAFAGRHKPWMLLSSAFVGFAVLNWLWAHVPRRVPRAQPEGPPAETAARPTPITWVEYTHLGLMLALIALGLAAYFTVPDSACVFCVRDLGNAPAH